MGYENDPYKVLWETEEVCRYVRMWARFAGMDDLQTAKQMADAHR